MTIITFITNHTLGVAVTAIILFIAIRFVIKPILKSQEEYMDASAKYDKEENKK